MNSDVSRLDQGNEQSTCSRQQAPRKTLSLKNVEGAKPAVERCDRADTPPLLERAGINIPKIDGKRQIAVAIKPGECGRRPVETALDPSPEHKVRIGSAMVSPAALILARPAAEFRIGH